MVIFDNNIIITKLNIIINNQNDIIKSLALNINDLNSYAIITSTNINDNISTSVYKTIAESLSKSSVSMHKKDAVQFSSILCNIDESIDKIVTIERTMLVKNR